MKNITSFFKNINVKSVFITLLLLFNIHFSFSQVDLRTCGFDCTSNNYTLTDVYLSLSNVNGDPITNTTCTIGQVQQVYIYLNYSSNSNSSIHFARLNSDLTINGVTTFLNVLLGTIVPGSNKKLLYGPFNWTCGEELGLTNTIIAWKTNSNNDPGPNYQCGSFTNSQCDFTNSFIISKPLAVQFTYKACKVGANTTVTFTSTTNGGKTPYTYAWDFQNNGGLPDSTLPNPTYTYTTSNNTAKLTVTDSQNISNSYTLQIIEPTELMLSESHTNVGCSGGTSTITLTATGGTPAYTYLWNTGATTKDLQDVPPGTYTVTATDSNSCTKQLSVTITSGDLIKPIIDPLPATSTINCPDLPVFTQATASDNSGTVTSLTYEDVNTPGSCTGTYSITRTWTAKDACNNISLPVSQTINVVDTTAPIWTTLATSLDITLECSDIAGLATAQNQAPIATDNCSTVTYSKTSGNFIAGSCANSGTYTNTWVAQDACLNSSTTFTQIITIQDTSAPIWTTASNALNVTLQCSDAAGISNAQNQAPVATDNCGGTVTYTKTSGIFVAGSCVNSGTYTNTWVANDVCLNTSTTFTQVITIIDNTAPIWTTASNALNVTLQCSDVIGISNAQNQAPVATDNCGGTVTYIKTSGVFVAGSCANSGTYTNTWVANDVCLNTSTTFTQVITIIDNTAPTWTTASNALNVTLQCSDATGISNAQNQAPVATDNCGGTVTYTKTSGIFVAGSCVNSGTYTNTWVANDVCLNTSTSFTQVITIIDNTAPIWTTASNALNVTLQCSDATGISNAQNQAPVATDNCGGTVTYTKTSGIFVASSCVNSGTYTNTWVANDVCLNTSTTFTQVITIEDTTKPTWTTQTASLDATLECSDLTALASAQALFPTASDLCDADVLNVVKISGQFVASGSCSNAGTYTNTWTVTDDCGNVSDTFTQVITIQDTTKPTWTTQTASLDATLECSDLTALASAQALFPTASDLCDADVLNIVKTSGQFVASGSCSNAGTYTNTWTVTDDCGNVSDTFTQVITIQDTTKPTWTTQTASLDATLECSDLTALASAQALFPTASDLCDADVLNIVKTSGQFVASGSCSNAGTYTNTWTVTDDCGNVSDTFTQVITIQDTTKPTWTTQTASLDATLECSDLSGLASAQALFPTASDLCDADVLNVVKISGQFVASGSCSNAGTYTNTWTVTDDCGNVSDTFTQVITIQDTTKPTWTTQTASLDATLECSDLSALASAQALFPTASDLCDADVLNVVKISGQFVASGSCSNAGTYANTWAVTDDCGNVSDTFTQVITIQDTTKPSWTTQTGSLDATLECSDLSALASAQALFPTASDLCDADILNVVKISGQFVASGSCSNAGTYTNTWTVTDDCGNISDTFTQIITIQDTTKPIFSGDLPTDITVSCDAVPEPAEMNVADNCNLGLPVVFSEIKSDIQNECASNYTLTRQWTTSDCAGNTTSFTQIITVRDTTPPTGTAPTDVAGLQSITDIPLANSQDITDAADNCSQNVTITINDTNNGASGCEGNAYILTRTYTLMDCAGNKTDLIQTFTVENKISVSGIASAVTCFGGDNGSILVTNTAGSTVVITNEENEIVGNSNLPAGTYTLTASFPVNENQACSATATVIVTQPSSPNEVTTISSEACADDSSLINLLALLPINTSATGTWIDKNNSNALQGNIFNPFGLALGNYLLEYQITDEICPRSILLNMEINNDCQVLACGNVIIHNAFSPNGDGINDTFKIDSIDDLTCYPENTVEIYNRWGILVFETVNYNNTTNAFDGTSRGRTTFKQSEGLPTGTYFYIINYKSLDGNNIIQSNKKDGFLYLSK
ncbi:hypothetical protein RT99_12035 [Flavobacterium sp. MEB061]|uniref:HYR-like domain-containing protein n=2 Tax=Flavobacterium sp. MEB061 TaxID=1587524 RepID=UPI0005ABE08F|nr:gliding motility-associated C-terminal domain-containing protein [Flavobacterium sp. MEB061]KIQ21047.1 hypothetical protein RT99_12035 [Flavobacterium sp. MEB061]